LHAVADQRYINAKGLDIKYAAKKKPSTHVCSNVPFFLVHTLPLEVCLAAALLHLADRGLETRLCTAGVLCLCSRFFCVSDMLLRLGAQAVNPPKKMQLHKQRYDLDQQYDQCTAQVSR
jgi:hypothetical protein